MASKSTSGASEEDSPSRLMDERVPTLFLSDLPIPTPPPMSDLLNMTSRFDFGFRSPDLGRLNRPRGFTRNSFASLRDFGSPLMSRAEYTLAATNNRNWRMPQRPVIKIARCRLANYIYFIRFIHKRRIEFFNIL